MDGGSANVPVEEEVDLTELFAPWDAKAWENLKDRYRETAAELVSLVMAGVSPQVIRRYALEHGYSPNTAGWMEQCALHVKRQLEVGGPVDLPAID